MRWRFRSVPAQPSATLREADAHALPFRDAAFDTMVCTFELCSTPAIDPVIAERRQVLRPGGRLVLVDHVASTKTVLAPRDLTDLPHRFAAVGALQLSAAEAEQ